ncbi:aKG-HExxH-type peptide beta-hydroxylase [Novosphingobium album (ex Liu et al. 2023)]|uniref:HEXXH motif-containing putative peptide modification protein n=1 Tax=Novosphingobium album (ex Liu et al. 2023) TaxID=3031130 RepID=A0ABT5WJT4_9SPHN|nr:HEXXH motif-containing putative peptide modification protein [Novosphingobium album (ex Liu et al. 2023)]MDE8650301.1 HEXXH motif-containing putative peptide modification protein [Novosphingobium album (ex Liu et al. 2023)]
MNYFEPSVARARECRRAMDEALWSSVRQLLADGEAGAPASDPAITGPTDLLDYGAYFDLTLVPPAEAEVPAGARASATRHLLGRLALADDLEPRTAPPRVTNFSAETYSADQMERMRRWWDTEPANRMAITRATDDEFARACEQAAIAMAHLRDAAPELHGEVETIVLDIVFSRPDGTNLINYGGASSFALWGAVTINAETQREWAQLYRQIVHETGHNLLFGMAREQPLVMDNPAERRPSPIRADARPMDGIFHAAFVSAREALAFDLLLCRHEDVGCLSDDDAGVFADLLELSVLAFWDCIETLRAEARLTELGQAILADCEAYMTANFAVEPC